ncbi:MAG TPA: hypothetical protein DEP48_00820 [Persephonella sp.]|uniref:tetratricopeptide repeat protein n=1 Tax=Persephonella TaxID=182899 RepID=UPI0002D32F2C|nr:MULTISPECIES: hypothetical protein [Persephonella]HCB68877.1 hypothetical protein [Persephonella sp.]
MRETVDKRFRNKRLISDLELAGLFVTVLTVLFLLFPKEKLMQYAKPENYNLLSKENIFLSIKYLEEIIKNYPEYADLKMLLIKKYIQVGDLKKADILLSDYIKQKGYSQTVVILKFDIMKFEAFSYPENSTERKRKLEELRKFLRENIKFIKNRSYLEYLFREAVALNDPVSAREIAYMLSVSKVKDQSFYLEKLLQLSIATEDYRKAVLALKKLISIKPEKSAYYMEKLAEIEFHIGRYLDALKHYEILIRVEKNYRKKLDYVEKAARISIFMKRYRKASYLYLKGMKIAKTYREKNIYFRKALKTLQSGNMVKEATKLIRRYGFRFIKDKKTAKLMIKIALQADDAELARKLSLSVLEEMR